ncbi:MAG: TonB-dependent receptor domain-containing protein, partial [bacterium]
ESAFVPFGRAWIAAASESSNGRFQFQSDNGTPYNPGDDFTDTRRNNDTDAREIILRGIAHAGRSEFTYESDAFGRDQGLAGIYSNQADRARWHSSRWLNSVTLRRPLSQGALSSTIYYHHQREKFFDPDAEAGLLPQDNRYTTDALGANLVATLVRGQAHTWTASLNLRDETFDSLRRIQNIDDPSRRRFSVSAALEESIVVRSSQISLGATLESVRNHFDTSSSDTLLSWHAGVLKPVSSRVSLKANLGLQHRLPSFNELFGDRGFVVGNSALSPERALNFDAGALLSGRHSFIQASLFASRPSDLILFIQNSQYTVKPFNIERAEIYGLELGATITKSDWNASANYTFQHTRDSGATYYRGNRLPGRPRHQFNAFVERRIGAWAPYYEFDFTGVNYLDRANRALNNGVRSHTLGVSYNLGGSRWVFEAHNLFDAAASDVLAFPLPGRSFSLSFSRS